MNITRLLLTLIELLLVATATGAGCRSEAIARRGRGVATEIATWPRPMTTPDTVRLDCRLSTLTTSPSVPPSIALPRMVR